ncbi:MAG: acetyl-CoA/propionyl-CoA carboxylase, biotin carboxylase, biotin carboxyl carrier protein [Thermomicrobiales bacterium]|nr:acetyl-CoA/propionyl-CoA carboxylase, biotin carboxylase, biotin carboxyl carrier protein [Thermomicrobiales bacterium]
MIRRVLIANRGEIAVRVIRSCRELGISPVAVYGEGEQDALHVRLADDAYRIPPGPTLPYLDIHAIIALALQAGAEAIHPGYGFLAENAGFNEACADAGLIFVGPTAAAIRAMGDKVAARGIAIAAGVPVVPGTEGPVDTVEVGRSWADAHGYPVAVKASAGGGGRGFRVAHSAAEFADAFTGSSGEAQRYFANPTVYLERYLERPRHIEAQIFADGHGNVVFLGERDCSVQRRHQKLIEETPSPAVGPDLRQEIGEAATALARAVDYIGAGTVEFMLAADGRFYFLEMNTRIQVEHTVTEFVTGIDLVKEQLLVACGQPLSFRQADIAATGHSIECRINAEDASRDFAPTPGIVTRFRAPAGHGVRVDTAFDDGAAVLPNYDSLIAKLVVWGRDRAEALARTKRALGEFQIEGVPTTIPFHQRLIDHPAFVAGEATTAFLAEHPEVLPSSSEPVRPAQQEAESPAREVTAEVNGRRLIVRLFGLPAGDSPSAPATPRRAPRLESKTPGSHRHGIDGAELTSPLQGTVLRVVVTPGAPVNRGDLVCVVEAMKMENEITAHRDGTVSSLAVATGDSVRIGSLLAVIE